MKHLSLFSGIGGLDLAAEWAGFETVAFVERDPYCQRVLAKRWPGVPIIDDVRKVAADAGCGGREGLPESDKRPDESEQQAPRRGDAFGLASGVSIVSGGFPCQPHSVAGKRQASADDRDLWPEFARVIRAIRPRWVVAENVPGLLHSESGRFFGSILGDLADMGYSAGWGVWGAADVGALHRRERVFIVAYDPLDGRGPGRPWGSDPGGAGQLESALQAMEHADGQGREHAQEGNARRRQLGEGQRDYSAAPGAGWWDVEPDVGRVANGVPSRVDRLRALGNAVVPQQAYPLFKAIADAENQMGTEP